MQSPRAISPGCSQADTVPSFVIGPVLLGLFRSWGVCFICHFPSLPTPCTPARRAPMFSQPPALPPSRTGFWGTETPTVSPDPASTASIPQPHSESRPTIVLPALGQQGGTERVNTWPKATAQRGRAGGGSQDWPPDSTGCTPRHQGWLGEAAGGQRRRGRASCVDGGLGAAVDTSVSAGASSLLSPDIWDCRLALRAIPGDCSGGVNGSCVVKFWGGWLLGCPHTPTCWAAEGS